MKWEPETLKKVAGTSLWPKQKQGKRQKMERQTRNWKNIPNNLKVRERHNILVVQRTLTGQICKKRQRTNIMQFKREAIHMAGKCKRCFTTDDEKCNTNIIKTSVFTNSLVRILNLVATSPGENARKPKCHRDPWVTSIPPSWGAVVTLGIYPTEILAHFSKDMFPSLFITALKLPRMGSNTNIQV